MRYILAIDQGTTSSRAILYTEDFEVKGLGQSPFPQHFPKTDWVEHDLGELWTSVTKSVEDCLASVKEPTFSKSQIVAIGITNQRETFGLWNKVSGQPVGRAIVWQCKRSADLCDRLRSTPAAKKLASISGLVVDPYFSGTKLRWWLENDRSVAAQAKAGELAFGTMDTYLIWKLTKGASHVTDTTNASRTMMMDLRKLSWSAEALKILKVPMGILPRILPSDAPFGVTRGLGFLPDGIPICGVLGDQQAALFGQECLKEGQAKVTFGTGAFFLLNTGTTPKKTKNGVSTVAWSVKGKTVYAVEGSVFISGAAVQWLRDGLGIFSKSSEVETLAANVESSDGVFFIPALSGLGAPYWAPRAKGLIGGLTRRSTKAHLARATLEAMAASVADAIEGLARDAKLRIRTLRVDGGASSNRILLQHQADLMRTELFRPKDLESTARGAAYAAALGSGLLKRAEDILGKNVVELRIVPRMKPAESKKIFGLWKSRVRAALKAGF